MVLANMPQAGEPCAQRETELASSACEIINIPLALNRRECRVVSACLGSLPTPDDANKIKPSTEIKEKEADNSVGA